MSRNPGRPRRAAFLTLDEVGHFVIDDSLAVPPLEALGWSVEHVPWRRAGDLHPRPDVALLRSTWDYHHHPEAFLTALQALEASGIRVENPLPLVRWNLDKRYLRELEGDGIRIVPTVWMEGGLEPGDLARLQAHFGRGAMGAGADEVILKPVVGAGSDDTLRIPSASTGEQEAAALALFRGRPLQVQPFVPAVVDEGEYSLIYLGGGFSHAILKTPTAGDFRVQEEFGSRIVRVEPESGLMAAADAVLEAARRHGDPLYARVDLVRTPEGWALMELELIEPSLYLRLDPDAPARLAQAVDARSGGR